MRLPKKWPELEPCPCCGRTESLYMVAQSHVSRRRSGGTGSFASEVKVGCGFCCLEVEAGTFDTTVIKAAKRWNDTIRDGRKLREEEKA